jgi:hypothetical protein
VQAKIEMDTGDDLDSTAETEGHFGIVLLGEWAPRERRPVG